jgi:c-di-GMP-binding flagellar brake protein YcgR
MEKEKDSERRKAPRVLVRVNVQLWEDYKVEKKAKGYIKNICLDGMCVVANIRFALGTDLIFNLNFSDELNINIYGKIIWEREEEEDVFSYGVRFTELDFREKPKLYRFILVTILLNEKK